TATAGHGRRLSTCLKYVDGLRISTTSTRVGVTDVDRRRGGPSAPGCGKGRQARQKQLVERFRSM
ncbi:hypothetical protein ACWEBX_35980, partial [Streptomyces sp. NPDC005070]